MRCPNCQVQNSQNAYRCAECNFGIRPKPKPQVRAPRYIGDPGGETKEQELAREFRCPCCQSYGANLNRLSTTGNGISRFLNFQVLDYVVMTCNYCQTSLLANAQSIGLNRSVWFIIDMIWTIIKCILYVAAFFFLFSNW